VGTINRLAVVFFSELFRRVSTYLRVKKARRGDYTKFLRLFIY
jgi:hypothetical protein